MTPQDFNIDDPRTWSMPVDFGLGAGGRPLDRLMRYLRGVRRRASPGRRASGREAGQEGAGFSGASADAKTAHH
ncbi:hypothetical protein [Sphingomonas sp.]|uniref:hypothetical protein n=1 Tax=Sphingomonas sp. TaxID=28214 RepID=UPI003B3B5B99